MINKLFTLLRKIKKDVSPEKEVKNIDYPEWTPELKEFVKTKAGNWKSSYYIDPKTGKKEFSYAKAFRNFFEFWFFKTTGCCPFHCYYSRRYDYVLFTYNKYDWDEKSGLYCFEKDGSICKGIFGIIKYDKPWLNK